MSELFSNKRFNPHLTRIKLPGTVYIWLIEGRSRALLVDTGYGYGDLKGYVDSLTDLPYDVVITHGHIDHMPGSQQFDSVYMSPKDLPLLPMHGTSARRKMYLENAGIEVDDELLLPECSASHFQPLLPDEVFDLGGLHVQALPIPGHSPGGMGFLIREYRELISSDLLNSITLVGLPFSLTVEGFSRSLKAFKAAYDGTFDTLYFSHPHNYGDRRIVEALLKLCDAVMKGTDVHIQMPSQPGTLSHRLGKVLYLAETVDEATRDRANLVYDPKEIFDS